jgi:hypothetical protein
VALEAKPRAEKPRIQSNTNYPRGLQVCHHHKVCIEIIGGNNCSLLYFIIYSVGAIMEKSKKVIKPRFKNTWKKDQNTNNSRVRPKFTTSFPPYCIIVH